MNNELFGSVLIGALVLFVLWFFFNDIPNPFLSDTKEPIRIMVDNGSYKPALIQVRSGQGIKIQFVRKDPSPCASAVVFPQLHSTYRLPMNQSVEINIPAQQHGELDFLCERGTFKGKIIII